MKQTKSFFLIVVAMCCLIFDSLTVLAQKETKPSVIAFQFGAGVAGRLWVPGGILDEDSTRNVTNEVVRGVVLMLSYDYLLTERFSIGGLVGIQNLQIKSWDAVGDNYESGDILRTYAGFRGNWHYSKNEKIDLYSGFKLGVVQFSSTEVEVGHSGASFIEKKNNFSGMRLGLTPIGARFFITDGLGINLETSLGSPSWLSFGFNYRF